MQRRKLFAASVAALGGVTLAAAVDGRPARAEPSRTFIPDVRVIDQTGRSWRFYSDLVKDRMVMLNFFFTSCGETCPLVTQNLREVQDILGERMGRDIFMYSITLDPELETPAVLADYAGLWDARPGWHFLTGAPADIETLRTTLGFADSDPAYARIRDSHTGLVRYGNDRLDRWSGTTGLGRPAWIAKTVASLADMG